MYIFNVPSGIGDFSWLYSKLATFPHEVSLKISGGLPRRTLPFTELLPKIASAEYADFNYVTEFVSNDRGLPAETNLNAMPGGEYWLSANTWLENGNRIEDFLPALPTKYHYHISTKPEHKLLASTIDQTAVGKVICVYVSKYNNYQGAWQFWTAQEWALFLKLVQKKIGRCTFVFLGAKFDNDLGNDICDMCSLFSHTFNLIGKTHIGDVVEILKISDYLFSFPSGIGVLGDVVNIPTLMWLPKHLEKMADTYADPVNVQSGRHINMMMEDVQITMNAFLTKGLQHLMG